MGYHFRDPNNKGYSILGSISGETTTLQEKHSTLSDLSASKGGRHVKANGKADSCIRELHGQVVTGVGASRVATYCALGDSG